ncbi:a-factor receptor [Marasmius tenuissimus]|uniref:A-factor receptor n=1 Tax=Marasmius tenuissimus TaxID=585030 RepID=A0ABR3A3R3_9AGAR|nr:a-factor receptor [Marasmius tenuissimus]
MSYPNEVYSAFSFLAFILVTIPLPWHLEAWNTGTCCFMIWAGLADLIYFINSIVWNGRVGNYSPTWCDISAKYYIGINVALPACCLCINRRLYHIATANAVTVTRAEKRRAIMVDLAICVGLPVLAMILHYIPQGHRYDIFEDLGCYPSVYVTWVAFVLVFAWPLAIACISGVYSILCLRAFYKRRQQFKELLSKNNNLNANRYIRLMCLAGVDVIVTIPLALFVIINDAKLGVNPWISWEDTHMNFGRVNQFPALFWKSDQTQYVALEISRWAAVMCSLIFFAFFGFADEARKNYRAAITSVQKRVGITSSGSMGTTLTGSGTEKSMTASGHSGLPVFVKRETRIRRDSLDSFTDVASVSSSGKDLKEKPSSASFGALSLSDVGGTLTAPASPSSPTSTFGSASFIESHKDEDEDLDIEISSLRYSITPPEAAHVKKDSSNMV